MKRNAILALAGALIISPALAADGNRTLFTFEEPDAANRWQTVNDGVMGGRSDGRFRINEQRLEFYGTLSLENNGGFASVRARGTNLGLQKGDTIVALVRGDGREYRLNLYTPRSFGGYSYRQSFKTTEGEWLEVKLPIENFVASYRGRVFPNQKLDPSRVDGLGLLLGDKKAGPFKLEIDWVKIASD